MGGWQELRNGEALSLTSLPPIPYTELVRDIVERCRSGSRPAAHFGLAADGEVTVFTLLLDNGAARLSAARSSLTAGGSAESLSNELPAFQLFERELFEEFGIRFANHPWLKPVRYPSARWDQTATIEGYPFFVLGGEGVHEVAVGPVHAGVIEPGHFRFMCRGERVEHLEIQLGYQHRGVEGLFTKGDLAGKGALAESICGTSSVAHAIAYSSLVEAASGTAVPEATVRLRELLLEVERIGGHLATLGALAGDVAYLPGASVCAGLRTLVINSLLELTGSRFGHGMVRSGGQLQPIGPDDLSKLRGRLAGVGKQLELLGRVMWSSPSVLSRFERTGVVEKAVARQIGMVGPAARASGVDQDLRRALPLPGSSIASDIQICTEESGDVLARAKLRYREILESIRFIDERTRSADETVVAPISPAALRRLCPRPDTMAVALVEGLHGEILHAAVTGHSGETLRYKVKDASFNNWFGLAYAVRGEGVSDFPLCNKSFDLSYAAHDL